MKSKNKPKCSCKSSPEYHRDDCLFYDVHGNRKKEKKNDSEVQTFVDPHHFSEAYKTSRKYGFSPINISAMPTDYTKDPYETPFE